MTISYTLLPYALTTVARAKDHLKIPDAETSEDERIERHINASTDTLERLTDRMLVERTDQESIQTGRRNNRILLPQWPVNVVTELWLDQNSEFTDTDNILEPSKYRIEKDSRGNGLGIVLLRGCLFPNGTENIKVVFDAGYQTIPSDLEDVCLFMVSFFFHIRDENRVGTIQKSKNQENITYLGDYPQWMKETISRYTRAEFALGNTAVENG